MSLTKVYERINWEDYPKETTALNERNLNKMDKAINDIDTRVVTLDTLKLDKTTANNMVSSIVYNNTNGIFTISYFSGETIVIDTKLEKIAVNFSFNEETQKLEILLDDGTKQIVDLSSLISVYEFLDTDTIAFNVENGKVKANVKNGSITENMLQPNFLADVTEQASNANSSSQYSALYSLLSEGYAKGTQNGVPVESGSEFYHNNAKYYSEEARQIAHADMLKEIYDTNNDGVVDNASTLDGHLPSHFATAQNILDLTDNNAITQVKIVTELPANPQSTVLYIIKEQ